MAQATRILPITVMIVIGFGIGFVVALLIMRVL
jgi:hypothetical protein